MGDISVTAFKRRPVKLFASCHTLTLAELESVCVQSANQQWRNTFRSVESERILLWVQIEKQKTKTRAVTDVSQALK